MDTPREFDKYKWISNIFSKIKGVEIVVIHPTNDGLDMLVTNNRTGKDKKVFNFPLKRFFSIDYTMSSETPHDYDVMNIDDPESMVRLGEMKAKMFFNPKTVN